MKNEPLLIGFREIMKYMVWSKRKFYRHRPELLACGVIFIVAMKEKGTVWTRRRVCSRPSFLDAWVIKKGAKGEVI